jgi:hypothetical protein
MKKGDNGGPATINLKPGIYVGAAISALFLLLPYVNRLVIPGYLLGPLAATWFMIGRRAQPLDYKQGAQLGFYSAFYGAIAAVCIDAVAAHFLREQLWRFENLYRIPPLLAGKGLESDSPLGWYLLMGELTVIAIVAAMLGTPSGLLGVKLFRPR